MEFAKQCSVLQEGLPETFLPKFQEAMNAYLSGNWAEAKTRLEEGLAIKADDGPTQTLMEVMGANDFNAPADWQGFRELTEK